MGRIIGIVLGLYVGYYMLSSSTIYDEVTMVNNFDIVEGVYKNKYSERTRSKNVIIYYQYSYKGKVYEGSTRGDIISKNSDIFQHYKTYNKTNVYVHKNNPTYSTLKYPKQDFNDYLRHFGTIVITLFFVLLIIGIGFLIPI